MSQSDCVCNDLCIMYALGWEYVITGGTRLTPQTSLRQTPILYVRWGQTNTFLFHWHIHTWLHTSKSNYFCGIRTYMKKPLLKLQKLNQECDDQVKDEAIFALTRIT